MVTIFKLLLISSPSIFYIKDRIALCSNITNFIPIRTTILHIEIIIKIEQMLTRKCCTFRSRELKIPPELLNGVFTHSAQCLRGPPPFMVKASYATVRLYYPADIKGESTRPLPLKTIQQRLFIPAKVNSFKA